MDDEPTTLAETVVDRDMPAPDARLLQEEREAAVNRALATLPVEQREAVRLVWQENMHQNEAARLMDIPRKVLRNRLLSAKATLRKLLAEYEDEYNRTRYSRQ